MESVGRKKTSTKKKILMGEGGTGIVVGKWGGPWRRVEEGRQARGRGSCKCWSVTKGGLSSRYAG